MSMDIATTVTLSEQKLSDILITAFEGGVGYWCQIVKYDIPAGAMSPIPDMQDFKHGWAPLVEGGGIWVQDAENPGKNNPDAAFERTKLDRDHLQSGLTLCAKHHPHVFSRILEDQYDSCDADIVVQLAVMGSVVFG
jgi:hypothetical protein